MKRGDMVVYTKRSNIPLKIISDPFDYGGVMVVNARTCEKNKNNRTFGLYAVNVLKPYTMEDTDKSQTD